jgi:acetylornithine deacetylase/succinyl-diaminopimelate desuccinylase-like protein
MNPTLLQKSIDQHFEARIIPTLMDYIRIPNKSPAFDKNWKSQGHMDKAMDLLEAWCHLNGPKGMQLERVQLPNRTPLLFIEIPGTLDHTILLYGHMDKQPEMAGWAADLDPWTPVLKNEKLYGRGGADDGYAIFAALTAINVLQEQNLPHGRCVVIIEASEESGSVDLPFYIEALADRIGKPDLVICLDSGCGNYEQLWVTTSLRGNLTATLRVDVLTEGVHSGAASGIVPSSFRIARELLNRIEDPKTGIILLPELQVDISAETLEQTQKTAELLGEQIVSNLPFIKGMKAVTSDPTELLLNRTWRATLSVTGTEGLPSLENAGNVLRPYTTLKLSLRMPPTCDGEAAANALKATLEKNPPYNAKVTCTIMGAENGWHAPPTTPALTALFNQASDTFFNKELAYTGEGGTIPFMGMLGKQFPDAQFLITGVLGPASNAHGPNEFLHIPMAKKLTACVAFVVGGYIHLD